tara:strand:- start:298 stop:621 length:324 start_codon:yes stop_codon:yes gene_type:complete
MNEDDILRAQINELIRDEIQEGINEYVDEKEKKKTRAKETGLGFVGQTIEMAEDDEETELKVNISNDEVERLLKEYKKIKKRQKKSNLHQIKQMGLVDKHGRRLKKN